MGVIEQYDSEHKRAFYAEVMGDGTDNIHFGKWDGVDTEAPGAYGKAATGMTNWMWKQAMDIIDKPGTKSIKYIDLGSGSGSAAAHLCQQDPRVEAMCINLCPNQNQENMDRAKSLGLGKRCYPCNRSSLSFLPAVVSNGLDLLEAARGSAAGGLRSIVDFLLHGVV